MEILRKLHFARPVNACKAFYAYISSINMQLPNMVEVAPPRARLLLIMCALFNHQK